MVLETTTPAATAEELPSVIQKTEDVAFPVADAPTAEKAPLPESRDAGAATPCESIAAYADELAKSASLESVKTAEAGVVPEAPKEEAREQPEEPAPVVEEPATAEEPAAVTLLTVTGSAEGGPLLAVSDAAVERAPSVDSSVEVKLEEESKPAEEETTAPAEAPAAQDEEESKPAEADEVATPAEAEATAEEPEAKKKMSFRKGISLPKIAKTPKSAEKGARMSPFRDIAAMKPPLPKLGLKGLRKGKKEEAEAQEAAAEAEAPQQEEAEAVEEPTEEEAVVAEEPAKEEAVAAEEPVQEEAKEEAMADPVEELEEKVETLDLQDDKPAKESVEEEEETMETVDLTDEKPAEEPAEEPADDATPMESAEAVEEEPAMVAAKVEEAPVAAEASPAVEERAVVTASEDSTASSASSSVPEPTLFEVLYAKAEDCLGDFTNTCGGWTNQANETCAKWTAKEEPLSGEEQAKVTAVALGADPVEALSVNTDDLSAKSPVEDILTPLSIATERATSFAEESVKSLVETYNDTAKTAEATIFPKQAAEAKKAEKKKAAKEAAAAKKEAKKAAKKEDERLEKAAEMAKKALADEIVPEEDVQKESEEEKPKRKSLFARRNKAGLKIFAPKSTKGEEDAKPPTPQTPASPGRMASLKRGMSTKGLAKSAGKSAQDMKKVAQSSFRKIKAPTTGISKRGLKLKKGNKAADSESVVSEEVVASPSMNSQSLNQPAEAPQVEEKALDDVQAPIEEEPVKEEEAEPSPEETSAEEPKAEEAKLEMVEAKPEEAEPSTPEESAPTEEKPVEEAKIEEPMQ